MSKVRVLIVEDELLVAEEMAGYLTSNGYLVHEIVDNTTSARRALEMYQVDIILIDIKLHGEEDGISLAGYVNANYEIPLIFVTTMIDSSTIQRALKARPSAYLIKPYRPHDLQVAIEVALHNFESQRIAAYTQSIPEPQYHYTLKKSMFIRDQHRLERIEYEDILWLKAESSYVKVVAVGKSYLLSTNTLGSILEKLNCPWLIRIHRSYAVNVNKVSAIDGNQIEIQDEKFPIGKNHKQVVKQFFNYL